MTVMWDIVVEDVMSCWGIMDGSGIEKIDAGRCCDFT